MKPPNAQGHSNPVSLRIRWLAVGLAGCGLLAGTCSKKEEAPAPAAAPAAISQDWPMWGGGPSRNMVFPGSNPPVNFDPGTKVKGTDELDMATTKGLKWSTLLGSNSYGTPVIAGGCVFVGTNNENPRDPKYGKDDRSVLMCLDEKNGGLLWQMPCAKLGTGKVNDWETIGFLSSPAVEGDRVYVITNRAEVVCLDLQGMKNGNQGLQDEVSYFSSPQQAITATSDLDADVIWRFDMRNECGVFPHNVSAGSVMIFGGRIYANTSNGVDWTHQNIPNPHAPGLICLEKTTGRLLGEEGSGISGKDHLLHCSWSSPAGAVIRGRYQIIFGGGDGFCYGFDPATKKDAEGVDIFEELWRYDANPPHYRFDAAGQRRPYNTWEGPSEIIATPVVYKDRAYILTGQDPEHGEGAGCLSCIDLLARGDLSGKAVWTYTSIGRSISSPSIVDDIIYAADYGGVVHALDALTAAKLWTYNTKGHIMCSSPCHIDGKIYIGNEEGELHIISAGRTGGKKINVVEFPGGLSTSPIYANGTLYVMTMYRLYAFASETAGL